MAVPPTKAIDVGAIKRLKFFELTITTTEKKWVFSATAGKDKNFDNLK